MHTVMDHPKNIKCMMVSWECLNVRDTAQRLVMTKHIYLPDHPSYRLGLHPGQACSGSDPLYLFINVYWFR
jgi:hypothetical protein